MSGHDGQLGCCTQMCVSEYEEAAMVNFQRSSSLEVHEAIAGTVSTASLPLRLAGLEG